MGAPSTGILDTFDRADGALGANWTSPLFSGGATLEILSNKCVRNATFAYADAYWSAGTFGGSGITDESYATLVQKQQNGAECSIFVGIASPVTSSLDAYYMNLIPTAGTDELIIYRIDNESTYTQLGATITQEVSVNDSLGIQRNGSGTIEAWYKAGAGAWASLGTRSDSTYTGAGYVALGIQGVTTNAQWDNFGGGNVGAATPPVTKGVRKLQAVNRASTY